jgi:hypothetical protein
MYKCTHKYVLICIAKCNKKKFILKKYQFPEAQANYKVKRIVNLRSDFLLQLWVARVVIRRPPSASQPDYRTWLVQYLKPIWSLQNCETNSRHLMRKSAPIQLRNTEGKETMKWKTNLLQNSEVSRPSSTTVIFFFTNILSKTRLNKQRFIHIRQNLETCVRLIEECKQHLINKTLYLAKELATKSRKGWM